jgi:K(+)-stimulated pyrophosphate-energized sodium pump
MSATLGFAPEWNQFRRWWITIAVLLALLLLLLWFAGYGPGGAACKRAMLAGAACDVPVGSAPAAMPAAPAVAPAVAPVVAAAAPVIAAAPAVAAVQALPPAAKIYFALDKSVVPADTGDRLKAVLAYLKANPKSKAVISGFHDPTGSRARNEELALNRARAVRSALERSGIANDRVMMQKPTVTTGDGPPEEARRVEVAVRTE